MPWLVDWTDWGGICRKQTWCSNLLFETKDIWWSEWKRNPADQKSGAKSQASQNRSDQWILQCRGTGWTMRIIPSLPLTCFYICTLSMHWGVPRCSSLMQAGELCTYMYARGAQRLKLQLDRSMLHLFRSHPPPRSSLLLKCQIYSHLIFQTFSSESDYADKSISYWFTFLGTQNISSSSSSDAASSKKG